MARTAFTIRPRSSLRCSIRVMVPSSGIGSSTALRPRLSEKATAAPSAAQRPAVEVTTGHSGLLLVARRAGGVARLRAVGRLAGRQRLRLLLGSSGVVGAGLLVILGEALGLGLEDAQRPSAAPSELRQLPGAEQQHEHEEHQDDLGGSDISHGALLLTM